MFGLDFNDLRHCAFIAYFGTQRWHIDDCREQYVEAKTAQHKRTYLKWQVQHLRNLDRCYDLLKQELTVASGCATPAVHRPATPGRAAA